MPENVEHLLELIAHTTSLGLTYTCTTKGIEDQVERMENEKGKSNGNEKGKERIDSSNDNDSTKGQRIEEGNGKGTDKSSGYHVVFRTSISGYERELLLTRADALLYTPDR